QARHVMVLPVAVPVERHGVFRRTGEVEALQDVDLQPLPSVGRIIRDAAGHHPEGGPVVGRPMTGQPASRLEVSVPLLEQGLGGMKVAPSLDGATFIADHRVAGPPNAQAEHAVAYAHQRRYPAGMPLAYHRGRLPAGRFQVVSLELVLPDPFEVAQV